MKFLSPLFSAVSGSVGGTTYSHNKGGMYARVRNIPPDKQSDPQLVWRPIWKALTLEWGNLTESERETWRLYALHIPRVDRLGQVKALSGHQHFFRSNAARYGFVDPLLFVRSAPVIFNLGPTPVVELTSAQSDGGANIQLTYNLPAGHPCSGTGGLDYFYTYISEPVSVTHTYRRNALRFMNYYTFASDLPPDTQISFTCYNWWSPSVVQASWFRAVCSYADGRLSSPSTYRFLTTLP